MFDDVLIGIDGHRGGHDAIALAKLLASPSARVALAHVYGAGLMPGRGAALLLASEREQSEQLLARTRAEAGLEAQLVVLADRSVPRGLQRAAAGRPTDLIVVGRGHRGLLGRALQSDDAGASLHGAPCPVAIAPSGYADRQSSLLALGVAYDGSADSDRAIALMRALAAARPGATMQILAAGAGAGAGAAAAAAAAAMQGIEHAAIRGEAAHALEALSEQLDLLIIGPRASGPLGPVFSLGTASQLPRSARCPLLVLNALEQPSPR